MSRDVADHIAGEDVHGRAERDGEMGVVATHALTRPVGIGGPAVASEEEGLDISETGMYGYPRAVRPGGGDREPCAGRRLHRNAVAGKTSERRVMT
jgi:hypothetical protein